MSFLLPVWLWAATAAAVPVLVHLLSRGRGRVVAVGTVRFLPAAHSHRLRRLHPSGLLRMLLRVALLVALAMALAAPRYWSAREPAPGERWALVDPSLLAERQRLEAVAPGVFRRLDEIDTTQRRLLAPGIPAWQTGASDSAGQQATGRFDLWSLIAEAAKLAPPEATLEVFVLDRVESLEGKRPDLGHPLEWWAVADPDTNRWLQRIVSTPDGIRATIGTSSATGTSFVPITLPADDAADPLVISSERSESRDPSTTLGMTTGPTRGMTTEPSIGMTAQATPETTTELTLSDGGSRGDDDTATAPPAAQPLRVAVLADDTRSSDAVAVRQAVEAVAAHLGRPLALAVEVGEPVDLIVELGEVSGEMAPTSIRLLDSDAAAMPCRRMAYIDALPDPWLRLRRCSDLSPGQAYWRDDSGRPLLSLEVPVPSTPTRAIYQWHGRFDPSWSNLTDGGLPHLLLALVAPDDEHSRGSANAASDRRAAPTGQGRPNSSPATEERPPAADPLPERLAWVIVAVLFIVDRLLVPRRV